MRPYGAWVGDRAVQLPAGTRGRPRGRRARHRQHGRRQGRERHALGRRDCWPTASATPACRRASSTTSPAPAGTSARRWRRIRDGRASRSRARSRSACSLLRQMAGGTWPRPCIAEMGGKNPCIVTAQREPRRRRGRHRALGLRHGRPEVLRALAPVRRPARGRRAASSGLAAQIAAIRIGDPCRREHWLGPVINAAAAAHYARYVRRARRRRRAVARGWSAAARWRLARGYYVEPVLAEAPARAPAVEARDVPADPHAAPRARSRRGHAPRERLGPRTHRGLLWRRRRGALVPRAHRGRRHLRQPAAGRDDRRVAGLPAIRRLEGLGFDRQGHRVVLLPRRNTCASSRAPSSSDRAEGHDARATRSRATSRTAPASRSRASRT